MPAISGKAIQGASELIAKLSSLANLDGTDAAIAGAEVILPYMQSITPVDTGELRNSEHIEVEGKDVLIIADADHASYVEFGTSRMRAQPYMRPAIDTRKGNATKAVIANLQGQLMRLLGGKK